MKTREMYEKRAEVIKRLEKGKEQIDCEQYAWNKIKEVMIDYPETIGIPLLEMAKREKIKVNIEKSFGSLKPRLKVKSNNNHVTIVIND